LLTPHPHRNLLGGIRCGPREVSVKLSHHLLLILRVEVGKSLQIMGGDVFPKLGKARDRARVDEGKVAFRDKSSHRALLTRSFSLLGW
jgi:hypothetical protein